MLLTKFKIGDKVIIKDTDNVRHYRAEASIGKIFIIKDGILHFNNNQYGCNYEEEDLELYNERITSWKKRMLNE